MKNQHKYQPYEPKKCWVGDKHKICYADEEEAEMAARLIETEHGLPGYSLYPYHCEYGDHWHLANKK
ncbi:MAG: hypothetical protein ACI4VS_03840 [Candidatus Nanosyncoccaceae bacterium]